MGNSNNEGSIVALMTTVTIIISIVAGIMSWSWIEPDSFFSFIGFLVLWGILTKIGHLLAMGVVALLEGWK